MRTSFFDTLTALAVDDERIFLLTGDLGFGSIESFARRCPTRFINVGVAEQNMIGVATGLALSGKIVFAYSIANFATLRGLEQIRSGPCYHNASVKVVSSGTGISYGPLGASHHATEDIAVMRSLPNMTVVAPADPAETCLATAALVAQGGPAYLRLGRANEPAVHTGPIDFRLGRAIQVRSGRDLTLISTGGMLSTAVQVADTLAGDGLSCRTLNMHTLRPLDRDAVHSAAAETRLIVTIEEHSIVGGLGGAVAEVLAELESPRARLKRIGLPSEFAPHAGSRDYLARHYGLAADQIAAAIRAMLQPSVVRSA
ncbi:MAG TPA: transketolase C-terminal domain-containing protein [Vicinamibacterales bacterium]|nr:transketolase C-terminal domain-containing protein [Vicinamibacterales bacterium]